MNVAGNNADLPTAGRQKRVLLLFTTTGYQAAAFREAAEKLGVAIVAGSDRCHVLEDPWRDGAIPLRYEDPYGAAATIVEYAGKQPLDAVIAIGDRPTIPAAIACEALEIPSHQPFAAFACHDKFEFRSLLETAGVPVPAFCRIPADAKSPALPAGIGFPCVLKPLSLSASRGVIRADDEAGFAAAFRRIRELLQSPDVQMMQDESADWILVEEYLEGSEAALEGVMDRGRLQVLALFDKPEPLEGPYFEETIYVTPSRLPDAAQAEITASVAQASRAVGLSHGPIHAEVRLTPEGPRVLEIAARPIGGLCARALRFENGWSLEELIIRHALGEPIEGVRREQAASGVMMIPVPAAGVLEEVRCEAEARGVPGVEDVRMTAKLKQKLVPWPEGSSYLGFIFARGPSPGEVETALREAHRKIEFVIAPTLPVVR
ncbi:MAG: ATP-grasp domain-containing protein [Terriglobia bacterium]